MKEALLKQFQENLRLSGTDERNLTNAEYVLQIAAKLCGDTQQALIWYRSERLVVFNDKTAEILVNEKRTADLIRYLRSLESGALG